ncbi:carbohydrate ABC transporter permease [Angustibacter sp. McL0619]|uniref:carbohydrate ABC transporter permease n=1 Tax=Angustibacter sp. McL0619 TaxID=3415676 RepID=UPI003CFB25AE
MATTTSTTDAATSTRQREPASQDSASRRRQKVYPLWFYLPAAVVFIGLFLVPTIVSFFFSLTRWTLFDWHFIGLDNFVAFFQEDALTKGLVNTLIYAFVTCVLKVVIGMALALLLTSQIIGRPFLRSVAFFPVLVSAIGIGITFQVLLNPDTGMVNRALAVVGIQGPAWLVDTKTALLSVAMVDVWKGVGLAMVIFIAGIVTIPGEYVEAAKVDGASRWQVFRNVILPLMRPATATVIILSLIGGLRSFDLIWSMTKGGPGFTTDVIASVIYKQYQAGFYGLSTAGNVILFLLVTVIVVPLFWVLNRGEVDR